jgi:hypothetical protein
VIGILAMLFIISSVVTFIVIKKKRVAGKQGDFIQSDKLSFPHGEKLFDSSASVSKNIVPTLPSSPVQAYQQVTPPFASPQLKTSTNFCNLTK